MVKKRFAVLFAAGLAVGSLTGLAAAPAGAADNCQHSSHYHYHFPYAHDDWHRYDGRTNQGGTDTHFYRNTTHADNYSKDCGDIH